MTGVSSSTKREQAEKQIQQIRSSPPSRRVQSRVGNVSGRYPSQKMGVTIQFESHHHELAGIYSMEYDSEVLEYYDQPPRIKLNYESASGRHLGVWHTPDFFVIHREQAGWSEWKTSQELERLAIKMPHRYQQTQTGQWRCPPGEAIAMQWGLEYRIRTDSEIDWALQRNLYFLEDYFRAETESKSRLVNEQKIIGLVESASESDCLEANRRYRLIAPYLTGSGSRDPSVPRRTFYRWVKSWRQAEQTYGYGYIGLLPLHS